MKNLKKLLAVLVCTIVAYEPSLAAYDVIVDGIGYILDESRSTAEVTYRTKSLVDNNYSGDVIIPAAIISKNKKYIVNSIGDRAFVACENLKTVTIPYSIKTIDSQAFWMCEGEAIFVSEDNPYFSSLEGVLYNKDKTILLQALRNRKGDLVMPSTVTEIAPAACYRMNKLTSIEFSPKISVINPNAFGYTPIKEIELPASLEVIGKAAFSSCKTLNKVSFQNGSKLKEIEAKAFQYDTKLKEIELPEGLESIKESAFDGCSEVEKVIIPASVTSIEKDAFDVAEKSAQFHCYVRWNNPPEMTNIFGRYALKGTLFVPKGTRKAYMSSYPWMNFINIEEYDYSSVDNVYPDAQPITINGITIAFPELSGNETVNIFDTTGKLLYSGTSNVINLNIKGLVIVRIGEHTRKIIL
jgi:hypothetical protein